VNDHGRILPMPIDAARLEALAGGREHDPFALLGLHAGADGVSIRTLQPDAEAVTLLAPQGEAAMRRIHAAGVFEWHGRQAPPRPWRVRVARRGQVREVIDCWSFPPEPDAEALYLFSAGRNVEAYRLLGAQLARRGDTDGVRFRTWAPGAERVSVIGEFNGWDGRVHPMANLGASGVWELFVPGAAPGMLYRFEIRQRDSGRVALRNDPYGRQFELRPANAARIAAPPRHRWQDDGWMAARARHDWLHAPMSIYEVHAGSWRRHPDGRMYGYRELADALVPYVVALGYTHIELMPITEHPLDESWGYQTTGYFAPTSRHGDPDALRALIDRCHAAGIGVILDWVPGHFPHDDWALAHFDGSALYEHADPHRKHHPDWGTHVFNYGRHEVRSFLLSSAHYWLDAFHVDGLRVDAVASMLYLDYSREPGQWTPNRYGGRENLEAIEFLRELNVMVHARFAGALTIAEESTAWPMVSRPVHLGGLGFSMKWNMGWMNDTLRYFGVDPLFRRYHHDLLTFGQLYACSENFVLPLSHDEVVHGKGALAARMPGDRWQRMANLRLLVTVKMTMPGKKLMFMGGEFAQLREWSERRELDWALLEDDAHRGVQRLVGDLNRLYRDEPALHELDFEAEGFRWLDCHDSDNSVLAFVRRARDGRGVVVVLNFTPVARHGYVIGAPRAGAWRERFNSDSAFYGGSNIGNAGGVDAAGEAWREWPARLVLTLPPLAGLILDAV
jgi:1,4-alpha-glucan branching enzyme